MRAIRNEGRVQQHGVGTNRAGKGIGANPNPLPRLVIVENHTGQAHVVGQQRGQGNAPAQRIARIGGEERRDRRLNIRHGRPRLIYSEGLPVHRNCTRPRIRVAVAVHRVTGRPISHPATRRVNPSLVRFRAPTAVQGSRHLKTPAPDSGGLITVGRIQNDVANRGDSPFLIDGEILTVHRDPTRARTCAAVRVHRVTDRPVPIRAARGVNPRLVGRCAPSATRRRRRHIKGADLSRCRVTATGRTQSVAANEARLIDGETLATHADRAETRVRAAVRVHCVIDRPVSATGACHMNPRRGRGRTPTASRGRRHAKTAAVRRRQVARIARSQSVATDDPGLTHGKDLVPHGDRAGACYGTRICVHRVTHRSVPAPSAGRMNPRLIRRRAPSTARLRCHPKAAAFRTSRVVPARWCQNVAATRICNRHSEDGIIRIPRRITHHAEQCVRAIWHEGRVQQHPIGAKCPGN